MPDQQIRPILDAPASSRPAVGLVELRALAAKWLHRSPQTLPQHGVQAPSDFDLNPDIAPSPHLINSPRPAAVLVPIIARAEPAILLTLRTEHLNSHAGQISFPGGKIDNSDIDVAAAALRESEEEIGLTADLVEPLGYLDTYRTGTGYAIHPLVGLVCDRYIPRVNPGEVAEVFEVPLAFLMEPANHRRDSMVWNGTQRFYHAMPYAQRYIWGATAGIIKNMYKRLFGE